MPILTLTTTLRPKDPSFPRKIPGIILNMKDHLLQFFYQFLLAIAMEPLPLLRPLIQNMIDELQ